MLSVIQHLVSHDQSIYTESFRHCLLYLFLAEILRIVNFSFKEIWEANFNFDLNVAEEKDFTLNCGLTKTYNRVLEIKQNAP